MAGRKAVRRAIDIDSLNMVVTFENYSGHFPRTIKVDMFRCGESDDVNPKPEGWWNTHASKGDMLTLLDRLGVDRPIGTVTYGQLGFMVRDAIYDGKKLDNHSHQIVKVPPQDTDDDDTIPTDKADGADALAEALRKAMSGAMDETKVREIVDTAILENVDLFKSPPPVQVVMPDGTEIGKVEGITHKILPRVLRYVLTRPLYLMGEAGTGKTTIASHVAECLGVPMFDMSCSEDMSAHHFAGYMDVRSEFVETVIYRWAKSDGGLLYLDEFDSITGECSTWLNSGFANKRFIFANGEAITLNGKHFILASGNTNLSGAKDGYTRQMVDKATIDRFRFLKVEIDEDVLKSEIGRYVNADTAAKVYGAWRKMRDNAIAHKLDVLVGARIAIFAAEAMRDGDTMAEAFQSSLGEKIAPDIYRKICTEVDFS